MNVNLDDFAYKMMADVLMLQAEMKVLRGTIVVLYEKISPETVDAFRVFLKDQTQSVFQELQIRHPYFDDEFARLLNDLFPKP